MINIYEQVDRNQRNSFLIIAFFVVLIALFAWSIGSFYNDGPSFLLWGAVVSTLLSLGGYYSGDRLILSLYHALPANRQDHFHFYSSAENLAMSLQIPTPKLFVIKSKALNAFATGRSPQHASIAVTSGLLDRLKKQELEAVLAHEFSHIINFDTRLMMIVAILAGMIVTASDTIIRGVGRRREGREGDTQTWIMILGIPLLIFAPLIAKMTQLAISRQREFLADANAVKITRYPLGLINALKGIQKDNHHLKDVNFAISHLLIANPFKKGSSFSGLATWFDTHPPIEARIAQLEKML